MKFNISAFTNTGTSRLINEDAILINGLILKDGEVHFSDEEICFCYVADGVGGNKSGEFASHFVLKKIREISDYKSKQTVSVLLKINHELLKTSARNKNLYGCATTLSGIVIQGNIFKIFHAGDSQIWLFRNDIFFKITHDHILEEDIVNSPITSYFGGHSDHLKLESNIMLKEACVNDLFLICSDGLFKSLDKKIIKSILLSDENEPGKVKKLLEMCLVTGAEDNVSVILIRIKEQY
jgi:serine/threonine protein phosphatase PrpC